jgi:hypothetical protein
MTDGRRAPPEAPTAVPTDPPTVVDEPLRAGSQPDAAPDGVAGLGAQPGLRDGYWIVDPGVA